MLADESKTGQGNRGKEVVRKAFSFSLHSVAAASARKRQPDVGRASLEQGRGRGGREKEVGVHIICMRQIVHEENVFPSSPSQRRRFSATSQSPPSPYFFFYLSSLFVG